MPIIMKTEGVEKIREMLKKLDQNAARVASTALYEGAGIMADEIKSAAGKIRTAPFHYAVFIQRDVSPEEKAVMQNGIGIGKFDHGSSVNTAVGYGRKSGYAMMVGRRKAIPQIANAINSGTSFMRKQPFVREAAASGGPKASAAMTKKIEEKLDEMTNK